MYDLVHDGGFRLCDGLGCVYRIFVGWDSRCVGKLSWCGWKGSIEIKALVNWGLSRFKQPMVDTYEGFDVIFEVKSI